MSLEVLLPSILEKCNLDLSGLTLLNKNKFSVTYKISGKNQVIKITKDLNKFLYSYQYSKIIEYENPLRAYFHKFFLVNDNLGVIIMDYYDQENVEGLYEKTMKELKKQDFAESILDIDVDLMKEDDKELKKYIDDLYMSSLNWSKLGIDIYDLDILPENIGKNKLGNYIIFNQRNNRVNPDYVSEKLRDLGLKSIKL